MNKDETLYPDAEAFNPDRWLNPKYPTFQEPLTQHPNLKRYSSFGFGRRICPGLALAERSLFIEISTLIWACSVVKKVGVDGVIPVPWYDYRPGNNTGPQRFDFDLKVRDEKRAQLLGNTTAAG
jgi:Cytochrome P450